MGVVYQATDPRLKRTVAIKLLSPDLTKDETAKQRFLQEAQAASALDHPNIFPILRSSRRQCAVATTAARSLRWWWLEDVGSATVLRGSSSFTLAHMLPTLHQRSVNHPMRFLCLVQHPLSAQH